MSEPYANAKHVLPPALLREVQRFFVGRLYIPARENIAMRRRTLVLTLATRGLNTKEIAERVHVSRRWVQQILHDEREWTRTALGDTASRKATP